MLDKRAFFINGQWVAPQSPRDHLVIDPSTEEPCAVISLGSSADTEAAVQAAKAALPAWRATPRPSASPWWSGFWQFINAARAKWPPR